MYLMGNKAENMFVLVKPLLFDFVNYVFILQKLSILLVINEACSELYIRVWRVKASINTKCIMASRKYFRGNTGRNGVGGRTSAPINTNTLLLYLWSNSLHLAETGATHPISLQTPPCYYIYIYLYMYL